MVVHGKVSGQERHENRCNAQEKLPHVTTSTDENPSSGGGERNGVGRPVDIRKAEVSAQPDCPPTALLDEQRSGEHQHGWSVLPERSARRGSRRCPKLKDQGHEDR